MAKKTFLYFAFGSNLLTERIQINNPSAVFRNIAKLRDHKLDFNYFSQVLIYPDMYCSNFKLISRDGKELLPR
jgi:hypothetical protein